MRLPRVRFTVRRLAVAVAVAALVAWGTAMGRRAALCRSRAHRHAAGEYIQGKTAVQLREIARLEPPEGTRPVDPARPSFAARARDAERAAVRHAVLKEKWERSARYPFLPVAPDPPEPE